MQPVLKGTRRSVAIADVKSQAITEEFAKNSTPAKSAVEFSPTRMPGPRFVERVPPRR